MLKGKIKNFENSDSSTRKDHLEPNNTNSKTEIQKASNTDIGNEDKNKPLKQTNKKKVVVTEDSMLNCISEKGLIKSHKVTVESVHGGTSNTIVENLDQLLKENSDDPTIHVRTNGLTNHFQKLSSRGVL